MKTGRGNIAWEEYNRKIRLWFAQLIQRIRLLYEIENPIIIQSEIGNGTEIIVTVKKMKGENYIC